MSFVATATLIGAGAAVGTSVWGAIRAGKQERKAKRQLKRENRKMKELEEMYANLDTSNPYLNLENTMEDLTINQQQADFERQSFQQTQANIMSNLRGAAGGSGIAGLAQSLAQQGQIAAQRQSVSIGRQETANQQAERRMASSIQDKERQGEVYSRNLIRNQTSTLLGMSQRKVAAAGQRKQAASDAKWNAISSGKNNAASMVAGFGDPTTIKPGGIPGGTGAGTGDQLANIASNMATNTGGAPTTQANPGYQWVQVPINQNQGTLGDVQPGADYDWGDLSIYE